MSYGCEPMRAGRGQRLAHQQQQVLVGGHPPAAMRARGRERLRVPREDELLLATKILRLVLSGVPVPIVLKGNTEPEQVAVAGRLAIAILHAEEHLELRRMSSGRVVVAVQDS